jgi:hypothetical protein
MYNLSHYHLKSKSSNYCTSNWNWQWLAAQQLQPEQTPLSSFHPAKVSKMSIRANPLIYSICGKYISSIADELEHISLQTDSELLEEFVTQLAKTT